MSAAPDSGAVLGIDIGYSPTRASGAVCRLSWTSENVTWQIARFRYEAEERRRAIADIAGCTPILCAAFDGPFRQTLDIINVYRTVERVLTRRVASKIGKPGPAHVPSGRKLNDATNAAVRDVLDACNIARATQVDPILAGRFVEAFPNTFLGVMLASDHGLAKGRGGKSERYFERLDETGRLQALLQSLLLGRTHSACLASVINHDDRAALVCALSALCVVADRYVMVGDEHGRIVLPPVQFWTNEICRLVRGNCDAENGQVWIERP